MAKSNLAIREAAAEVNIAQLLGLRGRTGRRVAGVVLDGIHGRRHIAEVRAQLARILDQSDVQARTLYDTMIGILRRQVKLEHATGAADELFFYVGPLDDVTRDFCVEHIGRVLSRAQIDDLDNGQLPDPLLTAGGYNCRHIWQRVSALDLTLQDLHKTGRRASHIARRLKQMAVAA